MSSGFIPRMQKTQLTSYGSCERKKCERKKGSLECNSRLSQTTGNCQSERTIQNNKSQPVIVGARPMCSPAWRASTRHHPPWEPNKTSPSEFSTTNNPKPVKRKRVSPNAIRAEQSAQDVAAASCFHDQGSYTHTARPDKPAMAHRNLLCNCNVPCQIRHPRAIHESDSIQNEFYPTEPVFREPPHTEPAAHIFIRLRLRFVCN